MFSVGFDIEIIKRWSHRLSPTSHSYIWRDEHILAHIGRGVLYSSTFSGRVGGKRGIPHGTPNAWSDNNV